MITSPFALTPTPGASVAPCKTFRSTPSPLSDISLAPGNTDKVNAVSIPSGLTANVSGFNTPLATT